MKEHKSSKLEDFMEVDLVLAPFFPLFQRGMVHGFFRFRWVGVGVGVGIWVRIIIK